MRWPKTWPEIHAASTRGPISQSPQAPRCFSRFHKAVSPVPLDMANRQRWAPAARGLGRKMPSSLPRASNKLRAISSLSSSQCVSLQLGWACTTQDSAPSRAGFALFRAAQETMPASLTILRVVGTFSAKANRPVQHGFDRARSATQAISKSCRQRSGAACSAGTATIAISKGPTVPDSSLKRQPSPCCSSALTQAPNVTWCGIAMSLTTAFIVGNPIQASALASGQGATRRRCCHACTTRRNRGSRAVKYCAPWSMETMPAEVESRRVDIRPPGPLPLSNKRTSRPWLERTSAQARPAMPAPTIPARITGSACSDKPTLLTRPCQQRPIREMISSRLFPSSRKQPRRRLVTMPTPGVQTPRPVMQPC